MGLQDIQNSKNPKEAGFYMPAEWHPHEATWLAWSHNVCTWQKPQLNVVQAMYIKILSILLPNEKVHLLIKNKSEKRIVCNRLDELQISRENLVFHLTPTQDAWIRDYGPTFLIDSTGKKAWCKWTFNAWGEKYNDLVADNSVFENNKSLIPFPCFPSKTILEGGSIEVNGEGDCLVTQKCLLNQNRNSNLSQSNIEVFLKNYLGVSNIIWLKNGISGDDTDGHIDNLARFADSNTILVAYEENEKDINCKNLKENWEILKSSRNRKGEKWNLIKVPMPGAVFGNNIRLPASYLNFYIANNTILLPVYDHPNDQRAFKILKDAFPDRKIVPILSYDLVHGLGSIHCITQQEPKAR